MATRPHVRLLTSLVLEQRWRYAVGAIFVMLGVAIGLSYPIVVKRLIDEGLMSGQPHRVQEFAFVLLGLLIAEGVATMVRDYAFNVAAERVALRLRQRVFDHLLRQEIAFFDATPTGELTSRLAADVPALQRLVGDPLGDGVRFALFGVLGTALLVYTSPALALLVMLAVPPMALVAWFIGGRVTRLAARVQTEHAASGAVAGEALAGVRTIRAFAQEATAGRRYGHALRRALAVARRRILANATQSGVSFMIGECAALLGLWAGSHLILQGQLTSGALISFVLYAFLVARGLRNAADFWSDALRGLGSARWLFDLLAREPRMPVTGGARPARVAGAVTLERVHFRYPSRPAVEALAGADLRVGAGETVALVGPSGAGKSSIVNLLLRFYDPDAGRVLVDGHDLRALDPVWLRSRIGVVMQEPMLFAGTIADNIRYGWPEADDGAVRVAALQAGLLEFIERLPDGFATAIGPHGTQLSGGQRQRVAIARAVLRRPRILILDEATNALDAVTASEVHEAVRTLADPPTLLVIAHRLSSVLTMDRIAVMDRGVVVATGDHDALLQSSPLYRRLVEAHLSTV